MEKQNIGLYEEELFQFSIYLMVLAYLILLVVRPIKLVSNNSHLLEYSISNGNMTSINGISSTFTSNGTINWRENTGYKVINQHELRMRDQNGTKLYPNWYFGVKFSKKYDPTYASFDFYYVRKDSSYETYYPITSGVCQNNTAFPSYDSFITYYWAYDSQLYSRFNYNKTYFQKIAVNINRWHDRADCHNEQEIDSWIKGTNIQIFTINSYYDNSDAVKPIK